MANANDDNKVVEGISAAADFATPVVESLRFALKDATALEALVILPLIERAVVLQRDFVALRSALMEAL